MNFTDNKDSILPIYAIRSFLHHEAAGGIALMISAVLAMIVANSPLNIAYEHILETYFQIGFESKDGVPFEAFAVNKPILLWINDGLMAIFFLLVGLEIKREIASGELASFKTALLPGIAAIGGMAIPALAFMLININHPENYQGWAIPAATDIAFALGVLSLLGSRAPTSLKVFLTAVAIFDDLGAIIIIGLFFSHGLTMTALLIALAGVAVLALFNMLKVKNIAPYILVGIIIWVAVLKSGIHATLAGVVIALFIPLHGKLGRDDSPLMRLEKMLHPWVAFLVLPIFGFANAGIDFSNLSVMDIFDPLALGIIVGLVVGKQIGIFSMVWGAVKLGIADKPKGTTWAQIYAVSILCGIGFTMSLFIGKLAFHSSEEINLIRVGVVTASVIAALMGYFLLRYFSGHKPSQRLEQDTTEKETMGEDAPQTITE